MMAEKKLYFVTKYALTDGIQSLEMEVPNDGEIYVYDRRPGSWRQFTLGRNCFTDSASATVAASKQRDKKIASLKKQIAKLENLSFEAAE
jgi:hypothetical protein